MRQVEAQQPTPAEQLQLQRGKQFGSTNGNGKIAGGSGVSGVGVGMSGTGVQAKRVFIDNTIDSIFTNLGNPKDFQLQTNGKGKSNGNLSAENGMNMNKNSPNLL